ncbi:MAG: hypothetical protein LBO82_02775 [Synergistaceae bacterium]|jgi:hypothetical protein|nr:hypothetical protein [Synergistaceae bacterium]
MKRNEGAAIVTNNRSGQRGAYRKSAGGRQGVSPAKDEDCAALTNKLSQMRKVFGDMKRFCTVLLFAFVFGVTPAFAYLSISVEAVDQFSDGADVFIAVYEDGIPVAVDFSFKLDDGYNVVSTGSGSTDENGEAILRFSGLSSGAHFSGVVWVGDYDDPEALQTFSFSAESTGCNAGGIGLTLLALIGLPAALKKKKPFENCRGTPI